MGDDIPGFRGDNETPALVAGKKTHLVADKNHSVIDNSHNIPWFVFLFLRQMGCANFAHPPPTLFETLRAAMNCQMVLQIGVLDL